MAGTAGLVTNTVKGAVSTPGTIKRAVYLRKDKNRRDSQVASSVIDQGAGSGAQGYPEEKKREEMIEDDENHFGRADQTEYYEP